ncbi:MAG: CDP-2,3-bis-(O-geranylgeranyl)-sn-glycerol synthase [Natronomonas sp.]|jgi:CDP-2,3-bis-(O-geranylgeranyl)-sn-glycerol synthase|uniref:CDP-2,3-bis-(O-geranylgeranyl)-sn-glycerol synthase n=1 Tax=Natronomonas sp. TaxID=2184060 RepID=UPI0039E3F9DA
MVVETVVIAVWAMLPAYIPNNVAVLAGGGRPIDGGRTWDGKRVLGDGKTWHGTTFGTAAGIAVALVLDRSQPVFESATGVGVPEFPLVVAVTLAFGAMFGDILASFLKRRTGRERGASLPGIDQLDFVVIALVLTALVASEWFFATFTVPVIIAVLVLTPVLHVGTNMIAYALGLKDEPW